MRGNMSFDPYEIVENWISKYKPQEVKDGFVPRGASPYIYEHSEDTVRMLLSINERNVWSLKWGNEDIFLVPGLPGDPINSSPEYVGFVVTEVEWDFEAVSSNTDQVVVVETPNECDLCGGSGEFDDSECPECKGAGEFWEEFGL
jgi:hypothetical protein